MKLYSNITMIKNDPVGLGIAIVDKLANKSVLCQMKVRSLFTVFIISLLKYYTADNITRILRGNGIPPDFCQCHKKEHTNKPVCAVKTYPTGGGKYNDCCMLL